MIRPRHVVKPALCEVCLCGIAHAWVAAYGLDRYQVLVVKDTRHAAPVLVDLDLGTAELHALALDAFLVFLSDEGAPMTEREILDRMRPPRAWDLRPVFSAVFKHRRVGDFAAWTEPQ